MWRKHADDLYAVAIVLILSIEAVTLGVLTWVFVLRLTQQWPVSRVGAFLTGAVGIAALLLMATAAHLVGYRFLSSRRERGRRHRLEEWTERWVAILFEGQSPPSRPLPAEAVESLLDLREALEGTEGERVEWLVRRYGMGDELLHRSRAVERRGLLRLLGPVRRRRLSSRLEALEALAKARVGQAIEPLLRLLHDREQAVRIMALRSLARTLARLPEGSNRDDAADRFVAALTVADLPPGAIEESLLLLEGTGPRVLGRLLAAASQWERDSTDGGPSIQDARLVRTIDAVGRLRLLALADQVAPFCRHANPEVRASALRALGMVGILPPGADGDVAAAFRDPVEYVRVQATRTAALLPRSAARQALWDLLGDESWWVRRGAAHAHLDLATEGAGALERAARSHPDPFARHMAVQVLLDTGRLDAPRARRLREIG